MVVAAKKTSQVIAHLAIAFVITYAVTGSMLIGGLAPLSVSNMSCAKSATGVPVMLRRRGQAAAGRCVSPGPPSNEW